MSRFLLPIGLVVVFGVMKLPAERALAAQRRQIDAIEIADPGLRAKVGQLGFTAALSGFRAVVADYLFIQAHVAWERTEWGRLLFLFRQVTTLQPHVPLFWEMGAWHMAWNASAAALNDVSQMRSALRVRAQREYFALGKDFLERGIQNNPDSAQLWEALARLCHDKLNDHERASECYAKAATLPNAHSYDRRFSAYELSYCEHRGRDAYEKLRSLYDEGYKQRLPTLIKRLKFLENKLGIPAEKRISDREN